MSETIQLNRKGLPVRVSVCGRKMIGHRKRQADKFAAKLREKQGKPFIAKWCDLCETHHLGFAVTMRYE